ncbi:MAG TPA: hypothetical protein VJ252_07635 [Chthoniobacterales bacterium]|jgi:hypothetical protein|nr:hypothetical protein [Chthoniobacterales bacterium]
MKLPAFFERMNRRERLLSASVAGVLFLLLNLLIWSWLFGMAGRARTELAAQRAARKQQSVYLKEKNLWAKRDQWLQQKQPSLKNAAEASTFLDQLKQIAGKYSILIENPAIGSGETTPTHQTVFASIETKSPWPPLVHFLYDAQQPDAFVVFDSVNLIIDSGDSTMMRGKFKIAKWFAPVQKGK